MSANSRKISKKRYGKKKCQRQRLARQRRIAQQELVFKSGSWEALKNKREREVAGSTMTASAWIMAGFTAIAIIVAVIKISGALDKIM